MRKTIVSDQVARNTRAITKPVFRFTIYAVEVLNGLASMLALLVISICLILALDILPYATIEEQARRKAVETVEFLFPSYFADIGELEFDISEYNEGMLSIKNVNLIDPENDRLIAFEEFNLSPSLRSLFGRRLELAYLGVEEVNVSYRNSESQGHQQIFFPINILDIPASVLAIGGEMKIADMGLLVSPHEGEEILALDNLHASLVKTAKGYQGRVSATQVDDTTAGVSFRAVREGEEIKIEGDARNYQVAEASGINANFDLNLTFEDVPDYDLTEQTENVSRPQDYLSAGNGFVRLIHENWQSEGNFEFDPVEDILNVDQMLFEGLGYKFGGLMEVDLRDEILLNAHDLNFSYPSQKGNTSVQGVNFVAKLDTKNRNIKVGQLNYEADEFHVNASGIVSFKDELVANLSLRIPEINARDVLDHWPKKFGARIYAWAADNVQKGDFRNLRADVSLRDELRFEFSTAFNDADIITLRNTPVLHVPAGRMVLTDKALLLEAPKAHFKDQGRYPVALNDLELWSDDINAQPMIASVKGKVNGSVRAVVDAFSSEPYLVSKRMNIASSQFSGNMNGRFDVVVPFQRGGKFNDLKKFDVTADISNLKVSDFVRKIPFTAIRAKLNMTKSRLKFDANGQLGLVNSKVKLTTEFRKGASPKIQASGTTTLTALSDLGVKLPNYFGGKNVGYNVNVAIQNGQARINGQANIKDISITVPAFGNIKPRGRAGTLDFDLIQNGKQVVMNQMNLRSGDVSANGSLEINGGKLSIVRLANAKVGNQFNGAIDLNGNGSLTIRDGYVDLRGLSLNQNGSGGDQRVTLRNMRATLPLDIDLRNINGSLKTGTKLSGKISGALRGRTPVNIALSSRPYGSLVHITSSRGGDAMRDAGLFSDLYYGKLDFKLRTTDKRDLYAGKFAITRTQLSNSRLGTQVLQAASIFGLLDPNGLFFNEIGGELLIQPKRIDLYSGHAYGPSVGLTLGGSYHVGQGDVDFSGVISPAYLLNGAIQRVPKIGELISGNIGEGVFGVTFKLDGAVANPNIYANPFSLLTPGRFRELWSVVPQARTLPEKYRIQ